MVDFEARVDTEDCGIGLSISWETIKFEAQWTVGNTFIECLELLAFERDGSVLITVRNEQSVFLDIVDSEGPFRQWGQKGGIGWNLVELIDDGVPGHRKWHVNALGSGVKMLVSVDLVTSVCSRTKHYCFWSEYFQMRSVLEGRSVSGDSPTDRVVTYTPVLCRFYGFEVYPRGIGLLK